MKGEVFLIPVPIHQEEEFNKDLIPPITVETINKLNFFAVENIRTARRFIKKINPKFDIDNCEFKIINKRVKNKILIEIINEIKSGKSIGVMSESGCPGIADPGQKLCELAHKEEIRINPLIGPSSILLALMASGLNGQNFTFHGYLPIKQIERIKSIKSISNKKGAHIFIETPYRNENLFKDLINHIKPTSKKLTLAIDICGKNEKIITKSIEDYKFLEIKFKKQPTIFIFE